MLSAAALRCCSGSLPSCTPPYFWHPRSYKHLFTASGDSKQGSSTGRASWGPAHANRKDLFLLGFYFSYKQWPSLPASDFPRPPSPPASTWCGRKRGLEGTTEPRAESLQRCCSAAPWNCSPSLGLLWAVAANQLCFAATRVWSYLCLCDRQSMYTETAALAWPETLLPFPSSPLPPPLPCRLLKQELLLAPVTEQRLRRGDMLCSCAQSLISNPEDTVSQEECVHRV